MHRFFHDQTEYGFANVMFLLWQIIAVFAALGLGWGFYLYAVSIISTTWCVVMFRIMWNLRDWEMMQKVICVIAVVIFIPVVPFAAILLLLFYAYDYLEGRKVDATK